MLGLNLSLAGLFPLSQHAQALEVFALLLEDGSGFLTMETGDLLLLE